MAKFGEVFSTTSKVVGAIALIGLIVGAAIAILGGMGNLIDSQSSASTSAHLSPDPEDLQADHIRISMPRSRWERGVTRAVQHHCAMNGMSKEEVLKALGEPLSRSESSWTWNRPPGKCVEYEGEACKTRTQEQKILFFTSAGNVKLAGEECEAPNGDYIFTSDIFSPGSWR